MDKRQLMRVAQASITEEQAQNDPAAAFHIALATVRAAYAAHRDRVLAIKAGRSGE